MNLHNKTDYCGTNKCPITAGMQKDMGAPVEWRIYDKSSVSYNNGSFGTWILDLTAPEDVEDGVYWGTVDGAKTYKKDANVKRKFGVVIKNGKFVLIPTLWVLAELTQQIIVHKDGSPVHRYEDTMRGINKVKYIGNDCFEFNT